MALFSGDGLVGFVDLAIYPPMTGTVQLARLARRGGTALLQSGAESARRAVVQRDDDVFVTEQLKEN
eukprot:10543454-Lingulodinium_polyedra.AAC.1